MPGVTEPDDDRDDERDEEECEGVEGEDGDEDEEQDDEGEECESAGGVLAVYEPPRKAAGGGPAAAAAAPHGPDVEELAARCERMRDRDERICKARAAVAKAEALWVEAKEKASNLKGVYEETVAHLLGVIDDSEEPSLFDGKGEAVKTAAAGDDTWQDADLDAMNVDRLMAPSTLQALREAGLDTYRKIGVWCQRNRLTDITGIGKGKAEQVQAALDRWAAQHAKPKGRKEAKAAKEPTVDRSPNARWRDTIIAKLGLPAHVEQALRDAGIGTVGQLDEAARTPKRLDGIPRLKKADIGVIHEALELFHRQESGPSDDAWRSESITYLDLPTPIIAALSDAGITTLGELEDYRKENQLTDLQRIGEKSAEEIEGALIRFWARRKRAA